MLGRAPLALLLLAAAGACANEPRTIAEPEHTPFDAAGGCADFAVDGPYVTDKPLDGPGGASDLQGGDLADGTYVLIRSESNQGQGLPALLRATLVLRGDLLELAEETTVADDGGVARWKPPATRRFAGRFITARKQDGPEGGGTAIVAGKLCEADETGRAPEGDTSRIFLYRAEGPEIVLLEVPGPSGGDEKQSLRTFRAVDRVGDAGSPTPPDVLCFLDDVAPNPCSACLCERCAGLRERCPSQDCRDALACAVRDMCIPRANVPSACEQTSCPGYFEAAGGYGGPSAGVFDDYATCVLASGCGDCPSFD